MSNFISLIALVFLPFAGGPATPMGEVEESWSKPAVIKHDSLPAVTVRARVVGDCLVVELQHEKGWHTYAMDNETRVEEKLAGQMSLGMQQGLSVDIQEAVKRTSAWRQSEPKDYSDAEILWYAWGFEGKAILACRIDPAGQENVSITLKGQACNASTCISIEETLEAPVQQAGEIPAALDWNSLVKIVEKKTSDTNK